MTITRDWLQKQIAEFESCAERTDGYRLDEGGKNTLEALRIALASLEAEPVAWQIHTPDVGVAYVETNPQSVESIRNKMGSKVAITPLFNAPPAPVVPGELLDAVASIISALDEYQDQLVLINRNSALVRELRAAMQGKAEPVSNRDELPVTQFKPVADLYGITSPTGSETIFTFDAVEARDFIDGGWSCQEYVELERYQAAMTNQSEQHLDMVNSPVIPDCWVACSERMPAHSKTILVITAFGEYWTGYFDRTDVFWCDETNVENVTHWMALPAAPQQESE